MSLRNLKNNKKSRRSSGRSNSSLRRDSSKKKKTSGGGKFVPIVGGLLLVVILIGGGVFAYQNVDFSGTSAEPSSTPMDISGNLAVNPVATGNAPTPIPVSTTAVIVPTTIAAVNTPIPANPNLGNAGVDMTLFETAHNSPVSDSFRYTINITLDVDLAGQAILLEIIGDGVYSIGDTVDAVLIDGTWDGTLSTAGVPATNFTFEAKLVNSALFIRLSSDDPTIEDTPWYRLPIDTTLDDVLVDVDTLPDLPEIEELMREFDFSNYIQTTRLPDEQGGQLAHFQTTYDILGGIQSQQAQTAFARVLDFIPETQAEGTMSDEEMQAIFILFSGQIARAIPVLTVQTNDFININEQLVTGNTYDIDIQPDAAQVGALLGQPLAGDVAINLDIILNYSDHGGTFSVAEPDSYEEFDTLGIDVVPEFQTP